MGLAKYLKGTLGGGKALFIAALTWAGGETVNLPAAPLPYTGVNLAGAEFGVEYPGVHGVDYIYPSAASVDYYADRDMNTVRLPFRWERLQHTLHGNLNAAELARMDAFVTPVTARGVHVILDMHNYARYGESPGQWVIGTPQLPDSALADVWARLADHYKANPRVIFGLMNEPNNMATEPWVSAANAAIAAIRAEGAGNLILVCGNGWSGAWSWLNGYYGTPNGTAMQEIVDPGGNFAFELHQYLDADSSGSTAEVVSEHIGRERLVAVTGWLREHGQRGFLGEFAAPDTAAGAAALSSMLAYMEQNADVWLGWTYWAGGPWWGDYFFTIEPDDGQDRRQMDVLFRYGQLEAPQAAQISAPFGISVLTRENYFYRLQESTTLASWTPIGAVVPGSGALLTFPAILGPDRTTHYLQVKTAKDAAELED